MTRGMRRDERDERDAAPGIVDVRPYCDRRKIKCV